MNIQEILKGVPLFNGLPWEALETISGLLQEESHPAEARIIEEGAPGDSMFILVSGRVKITKYAGDGSEVLITKLEKGSYFGEASLIDRQPRSANVITDVRSVVLRLKKDIFEQMLLSNSGFAVGFYKNCLDETIARMRETASNLTVSQNVLTQKTSRLDRIDADLSDAAAIQDYFLSKEQLQDEGFLETGIRHSYIYEPFLEVGGDFLNIARLKDGSYGLIIADVMGHGISAAMATGVLRSAFSIFSKQHGDCPSELMFHMNNHMHEIFSSLFTTAYYALIDPSSLEIRLSKAGHAHPLVWRSKAGALQRFDLPGPGLGIKAGMKYTDMTMCIDKGDKVLFYTDGVEEQKNMEGEMYGLERLESQFVCLCKEGREHLIQHLFSDFESFKGNCDYHDDVTLFLLEFVGPPVGDGVA